MLGQDASEHRSRRRKEGRGASEDAQRPAALGLREDRARDRQGGGHHQRRPGALRESGRDRPDRVLREPDQGRGDDEDRGAGEEDAAQAEQVAEPAAQHHEAARGRMFAVRIQGPSSRFPPRSRISSGTARGTAVWSTRIMLLARVIAASVSQRVLAPGGSAWSAFIWRFLSLLRMQHRCEGAPRVCYRAAAPWGTGGNP